MSCVSSLNLEMSNSVSMAPEFLSEIDKKFIDRIEKLTNLKDIKDVNDVVKALFYAIDLKVMEIEDLQSVITDLELDLHKSKTNATKTHQITATILTLPSITSNENTNKITETEITKTRTEITHTADLRVSEHDDVSEHEHENEEMKELEETSLPLNKEMSRNVDAVTGLVYGEAQFWEMATFEGLATQCNLSEDAVVCFMFFLYIYLVLCARISNPSNPSNLMLISESHCYRYAKEQ